MSLSDSPSTARPRFRFRFSLRSLLFFVLLIGSGATLWWNWAPWVAYLKFPPIDEWGQNFHSLENRRPSFSPNGANLVVWDYIRRMECVLDVQSGKWIFELPCPEGSGRPYLTDSGILVAADLAHERVWNAWDIRTHGKHMSGEFKSGDVWITKACGDFLYTFDKEGITIWDLVHKREMFCFSAPIYSQAPKYEIKPEIIAQQKRAVAAMDLNEFAAMTGTTGTTSSPKLAVHATASTGAPFLATIVEGTDRAQIWNLNDGRKLYEVVFPDNHPDRWIAAVAPTGDMFTTINVPENDGLWNAQSGTLVAKFNEELAQFSPDGKRVYGNSAGGNFRCWDCISGNALTQPQPISEEYDLKGTDGKLFLWNVGNHTFNTDDGNRYDFEIRDLFETFKAKLAHQPRAAYATFSSDGRWMATNMWLYHRVRPEQWWGVVTLPIFWVTVFFASAFLWNFWSDQKSLGKG